MNDLENLMAPSRDPNELLRAWEGWHAIGPPMRQRYSRMVALANKGARELGFADTGAMWRSGYDMPPDEFRRRIRSPVAAGSSALRLASCLRALAAREKIWAGRRARRRADSGAPARQYLGAGLDEYLSARRAAQMPIPATTLAQF